MLNSNHTNLELSLFFARVFFTQRIFFILVFLTHLLNSWYCIFFLICQYLNVLITNTIAEIIIFFIFKVTKFTQYFGWEELGIMCRRNIINPWPVSMIGKFKEKEFYLFCNWKMFLFFSWSNKLMQMSYRSKKYKFLHSSAINLLTKICFYYWSIFYILKIICSFCWTFTHLSIDKMPH